MQDDSAWNFGLIEVEIQMEHSDIRRMLPCKLAISLLQQQQNLGRRFGFKAASGLGCCPF